MLTWEIERMVREAQWQHPDSGTGPQNHLSIPDSLCPSATVGMLLPVCLSPWSEKNHFFPPLLLLVDNTIEFILESVPMERLIIRFCWDYYTLCSFWVTPGSHIALGFVTGLQMSDSEHSHFDSGGLVVQGHRLPSPE